MLKKNVRVKVMTIKLKPYISRALNKLSFYYKIVNVKKFIAVHH